nr:DUF202 domain-containing protein [Kibdelosporangium sp. MJ126-NF4]CEL18115.1 hypothetical protein [Kibdelosporangium sp. MJ126-NF4]CTQ90656.1 hypothetical protein [Kibdelosporangium sp. MJ126-NF4]
MTDSLTNDPGRQLERTVLSWQRTWIAFTLFALILLRVTAANPVIAAAVSATVLCSSAGPLVTLRQYRRQFTTRASAGAGRDARLPLLLSTLATAMATISLTVILASGGAPR